MVSLAEKLERSLDKSGECWVFTGGYCDRDGYGKIWGNGRKYYAHRLAWSLVNGPIPEGMCVLHDCDNPPCCNPDHLHLGTIADNNQEKADRGRAYSPRCRGERNGRAKITKRQVLEMRNKHASGNESYSSLGREYGITPANARKAILGISWSHV